MDLHLYNDRQPYQVCTVKNSTLNLPPPKLLRVSMPSRSKITESSFTKAMFKSRCEFSITFAASATLIDDACQVPASIIGEAYKASTSSAISGVLPLVIFRNLSQCVYFIPRIYALWTITAKKVLIEFKPTNTL